MSGLPSPTLVLITDAYSEVVARLRGRSLAVLTIVAMTAGYGAGWFVPSAIGLPPAASVGLTFALGLAAGLIVVQLLLRRNRRRNRRAWLVLAWARVALGRAAAGGEPSDLASTVGVCSIILEQAMAGTLRGKEVDAALDAAVAEVHEPSDRTAIGALIAVARARLAFGAGDRWREILNTAAGPIQERPPTPSGERSARRRHFGLGLLAYVAIAVLFVGTTLAAPGPGSGPSEHSGDVYSSGCGPCPSGRLRGSDTLATDERVADLLRAALAAGAPHTDVALPLTTGVAGGPMAEDPSFVWIPANGWWFLPGAGTNGTTITRVEVLLGGWFVSHRTDVLIELDGTTYAALDYKIDPTTMGKIADLLFPPTAS